MSRLAIGVMCRVPHGGGGKSRLRGRYDAAFVDALQAAMLADTLAAADRLSPVHPVVFVAPVPGLDAVAAIRRDLRDGWEVAEQSGNDLGARIVGAFSSLFGRGAGDALVVGSDSPMLDLSPSHFAGLRDDEVLLYPCDDGGYAGIGLRRLEPRLFEGIPWSTAAVTRATRERASACGLGIREVSPTFDVDAPHDVERLRAELANEPTRAPRTAALLGIARAVGDGSASDASTPRDSSAS